MCKPWSSNLSGCCCCDLSIMRPATGKVFFLLFFFPMSFLSKDLFDEAFSQEPVWKTILTMLEDFHPCLSFQTFPDVNWGKAVFVSGLGLRGPEKHIHDPATLGGLIWILSSYYFNAQGLVLRVKPFGWMLKVLIRPTFWDRENTTCPLLKASWFTGE